MSSRRTLGMTALPCMVTLAWCLAALGRGEKAQPDRTPATGAASPRPYIFGARYCAACHDQYTHPTYTKEERTDMICGMDEFRIFDTRDSHKLAHAALTGARGRQMSRLLGTEVAQLDACLNCHSARDRGVSKQQYTRETDGVTCVACHGPYSNWVEKHPEIGSDDWRRLDRKAKEREYGMTDLGDPVRRTELCASCHVGNHSEDKVITHAMYAAGHPPLANFEPATFGDHQPRHWESLREKLLVPGRAQRQKPPPNPKNLEQTPLVATGGLVVLRESMRLFAGQAAAINRDLTSAPWPDFARFDCQACHHDLKSGDAAPWRQTRGYPGAPGRPGAPEWPQALVRFSIEAASPQNADARTAEWNKHLDAFRNALAVQPFGDSERSVPAAREIVRWSDTLLDDLRRSSVNHDQAEALLSRLCRIARERTPDYDSARQIAWAFRAIYQELEPTPPRDTPIARRLAELDAQLLLTLTGSREQAAGEKAVTQRLRASETYDPVAFQAQFAGLERDLATLTRP